VTTTSVDAPYTLKRVQEMLGLSRTTISGLIAAGFVAPVRGARNAHRFSFQDLMLMRTAFALQQASIPPRKILRALSKLKAELPAEVPLTGLRITAMGADVAVRDRSGRWEADTGQLLMDFEVTEVAGTVSFIPAPAAQTSVPVDWFQRGVALESTDAQGAQEAFRRAITADPGRPEPYLNLGALLCESGRCADAAQLYEDALALVGHDPVIHFNLAIALEDIDQIDAAMAAYEQALILDGDFADAHYNLGMLLQRRGDGVGALRHFNAYRRLERREGR
jgi:tetratricopeptide (TPR) repeat protein